MILQIKRFFYLIKICNLSKVQIKFMRKHRVVLMIKAIYLNWIIKIFN